MDAFSQTTFSNDFSWMKMYAYRLKFHWSLFLRVQLAISQHWFRLWLGTDQATSHYLDQWWLDYRRIYASVRLNELIIIAFTKNHAIQRLISNSRILWDILSDKKKKTYFHWLYWPFCIWQLYWHLGIIHYGYLNCENQGNLSMNNKVMPPPWSLEITTKNPGGLQFGNRRVWVLVHPYSLKPFQF